MTIETTKKHRAVLMPDGKTEHGVEPRRFDGALTRVIPHTSRDVFGLQMLDLHREKFAPAKGGGLLVTPEALQKILR